MATRIVSMAAHLSITQTRVSIWYCLLSGCLYALTWNALGWDQFSETPAICLDSSIAEIINSYFGMAAILVNLLWIVVWLANMAVLYLHLSSSPTGIELPLLLFLTVLLSSWRMFHLYTARLASRVRSVDPVQLNSVFVLGPTAILILLHIAAGLECTLTLLWEFLVKIFDFLYSSCSLLFSSAGFPLLFTASSGAYQIFLYVPGIATSVMHCNNLSGNISHMTTCDTMRVQFSLAPAGG